jgi:thiol-disulfide isomerase/thioredoxin
MNIKLPTTLLAAFCLSLTACDVIEGPKVDPSGFAGSTNKVLLEDFTGHLCGYCPGAHVVAADLKSRYGDNVVVVAVHASGHASVLESIGYGYDFRTPMGTDLENHYHGDQLKGYPVGLVQRRDWGGTPLVDKLNWGANVATILAEEPKMKLDVRTTFDPNDRSLHLETGIEYFTEGTAAHQIVAIVTEDSIVAKQTTYNSDSLSQYDYVHNHVLRGSITPGTWGVPVKGNRIVLGEKFSLAFDATLPALWVAKHCHVVVYVHDNATKEILAVEEVDLVD